MSFHATVSCVGTMGATNPLSVEFASASGDTIVFANTPNGAQTRRLTAVAVLQSQTVHKRWTLMKHEMVPASSTWQGLPTPMESLVTIKEAGHGIVALVTISVVFSAGVVEFRCQLNDVSIAYYVLDAQSRVSANLSYSGAGVSFHAASGPLHAGKRPQSTRRKGQLYLVRVVSRQSHCGAAVPLAAFAPDSVTSSAKTESDPLRSAPGRSALSQLKRP